MHGPRVSAKSRRLESFLWVCSAPHLQAEGFKKFRNVFLSCDLVRVVESEMSPNQCLMHFRKSIMSPHRSNNQNTQTVDVHPTHGMRIRNRDHTLDFVIASGVPPVQTIPPRAPRAPRSSTNRTQPPQREISNAEFRQSIHVIAQLVGLQAQRSEDIGSASVTYEASRVGQFMRINPPKFTGTMVVEDLQEFIDEMEKIF